MYGDGPGGAAAARPGLAPAVSPGRGGGGSTRPNRPGPLRPPRSRRGRSPRRGYEGEGRKDAKQLKTGPGDSAGPRLRAPGCPRRPPEGASGGVSPLATLCSQPGERRGSCLPLNSQTALWEILLPVSAGLCPLRQVQGPRCSLSENTFTARQENREEEAERVSLVPVTAQPGTGVWGPGQTLSQTYSLLEPRKEAAGEGGLGNDKVKALERAAGAGECPAFRGRRIRGEAKVQTAFPQH